MAKCTWCGSYYDGEGFKKNGKGYVFNIIGAAYCSPKCAMEQEESYKNKQVNPSNFSGGGAGVGNIGWVWWLIGIIIAVFIFLSPAMLFIYAFDLANPEGVMDTTLNSGWAWLGSALFWGGLIGGIIYLVKRKKANL
jgi:hypothetical protein